MKKSKHIIVRITETQFRRLADALITEQKNKSTIVRDALDKYMDSTERMVESQIKKHNDNKQEL